MTERLVIGKTEKFTRRRWAAAVALTVVGGWLGVLTIRDDLGHDSMYLGGFLAILGLLLLGWMLNRKTRKRTLLLGDQAVELRASDGSGWRIALADIERLVLRRSRQADDHHDLPVYAYELRIRLHPGAEPGKQPGLTSTTRGLVQTTPDRFTEAEAWRIQEFARDRLGVPVVASQVPPTVRGEVVRAVPPPPAEAPDRRQVVVFPAGLSTPLGTVYATRPNPRVKRVFATVMGWTALAAVVAMGTFREIAESTALFFTFLGVVIGGVTIPGWVSLLDSEWRARRRRAPELRITATGLLWKYYKPTKYREPQVPYRFELRWAEVSAIQVTTHVVDGSTVRTVEIVPGDDEFAKRHPEMQRLWEAGLQLGEAVPPATGAYRLQTEFAAKAARRLAGAAGLRRPGVLRDHNLTGSGRS
ncbi:hypothetical protein [Amycolatopsis albispora]|uniref:Uncharacterized protein n=1 Tax=Amycolatopsis albispora TaxID=1804986 RepID=A0A344LF70_9PSEU|nr:hypothetical protein [Amycolatopsis albispora]AXB46694.1 hypothetical protein A4R43_33165 [Amycolatopsis albispora]